MVLVRSNLYQTKLFSLLRKKRFCILFFGEISYVFFKQSKLGIVFHIGRFSMCSCTSNGNDKFKVIFFDNDGNVTMVEESQKRKRHSEANLYVVPFARYQLMETMPLSMMKHLDEEVPPVFMILDTYDKDIKSLLPGTHLFCVYGDNWFQSVR